jgi:hypothetical protein
MVLPRTVYNQQGADDSPVYLQPYVATKITTRHEGYASHIALKTKATVGHNFLHHPLAIECNVAFQRNFQGWTKPVRKCQQCYHT